ncbi:Reverse transcriptase [Theobroma cacao]|nr:Reverse transcriptase [Theobroma cacao]
MTCDNPNKAWDRLKDEFHGSERTIQMQALNLHREFEILRMKEDETIKEYSDKIMKLVNQLKLLGEDLTKRRIVNKVLVSLPEKFEAKISSFVDSKNLSQLTVTKLVNALQAYKQRRAIRHEDNVEGALLVKNESKNPSSSSRRNEGEKKDKEKRMNYGKQKKNRGNQSKTPFPKQSLSKANEKLELVHSDVGGPMKTESLNGSLYYMIFIDDCRNVRLLTDNQGAFPLLPCSGAELLFFLFTVGQLLTVPPPLYTRLWLLEGARSHYSARCEFFTSGRVRVVPGRVEAINVAVNLLNILSTQSLNSKTPHEAWFGYKLSISHIRVFGCVSYAQIPDEKISKLDAKTQVVINLGFSEISEGYRLYDVETKKVQVSRDVAFDEFSRCNWGTNSVESSKDLSIINDGPAQLENQLKDENIDDYLVRGTRSLQDVYECCNVIILEPTSYIEATKDQHWIKAMCDEIEMINKNQTWHLVDKPANQKVIGVKWVFKTKLNADGTVNKYKAHLVAKGYAQEYGVDFSETFAPMARHDTIRLLTA